MLRNIFISFILITSVSSILAPGRPSAVPVPGETPEAHVRVARTYTHNPYGPATLAEPPTSAGSTQNGEQPAGFLGATVPHGGILPTGAVLPTSVTSTGLQVKVGRPMAAGFSTGAVPCTSVLPTGAIPPTSVTSAGLQVRIGSTQPTRQLVPLPVQTALFSETVRSVTQGDFLDRIRHEVVRLGNTACSRELIENYEDLVLHCKEVSQNKPLHIRLELQGITIYALLGLSNVYGKMGNNSRKFETARDAFLLCTELLHINPDLLTFGRTIKYRAGTCIYAMSQAIFYMFEMKGDDIAAQRIYEESLKLIGIHIEEGNSKNTLLECFGYRSDIGPFLFNIKLR